MAERETIVLSRDVHVVTIPEGTLGTLVKGSTVTLHQALGTNYTVISDYGQMVRVAGADADALGKQIPELHTLVCETDTKAIEKNCWEVMKTVYDPEIPVNVVELGLIYACEVTACGEGKNDVHIQMTLTAPGCGMGPILQNDLHHAVADIKGVESVYVEVVLDPPWSQEMMSEVAKVQLGLF